MTNERGERYVGQPKAMLLLTAQGIRRVAAAGMSKNSALPCANMPSPSEHAFTCKSRPDACHSATEYLKSIQ